MTEKDKGNFGIQQVLQSVAGHARTRDGIIEVQDLASAILSAQYEVDAGYYGVINGFYDLVGHALDRHLEARALLPIGKGRIGEGNRVANEIVAGVVVLTAVYDRFKQGNVDKVDAASVLNTVTAEYPFTTHETANEVEPDRPLNGPQLKELLRENPIPQPLADVIDNFVLGKVEDTWSELSPSASARHVEPLATLAATTYAILRHGPHYGMGSAGVGALLPDSPSSSSTGAEADDPKDRLPVKDIRTRRLTRHS